MVISSDVSKLILEPTTLMWPVIYFLQKMNYNLKKIIYIMLFKVCVMITYTE
jgi:hypothetical protein